jgi:DNA-binding XRE family transcriptional regulator
MENNRSKTIRKNRVRELRENRLMTQAQLARKAKVALRTIHSVEKGMNCRMDTKRKILLALGLRFEDKDQVFPPMSAYGSDGQHRDPMSPHGSHGSGDQGPPSTPHSF